jgi:oligopeptide transport system ATP-binding protein
MKNLLDIDDLRISFNTYAGEVKAIRGVSFCVKESETLGIVGESGCGKSVTMMSILKLLPEISEIKSGQTIFNGQNITHYTNKQMDVIRGNEISMIFQDPMTSLNPVFTIGDQIMEHQIKHKRITSANAYKNSLEILSAVGIPKPDIRMKQYPHEFSGGMRQRVMIAMALVNNPMLLIADEPTTALDVTIQAQILALMKQIKLKMKMSIILITHDLGVVAEMSDRILVMYGGKIVEYGTKYQIFYNPKHPYTWGLLNSIPNPKNNKERLKPIIGQPPDLISPPEGCPFAPRCPFTMSVCEWKMPEYFDIEEGHKSACWMLHPYSPKFDTHNHLPNISLNKTKNMEILS